MFRRARNGWCSSIHHCILAGQACASSSSNGNGRTNTGPIIDLNENFEAIGGTGNALVPSSSTAADLEFQKEKTSALRGESSSFFHQDESAEARLVSMEDAYHTDIDSAWSRVPKVKIFKEEHERRMSEGMEDVHANRQRVKQKRKEELDHVLARAEIANMPGSAVDNTDASSQSRRGPDSLAERSISPLTVQSLTKKIQATLSNDPDSKTDNGSEIKSAEELLSRSKKWVLKRDKGLLRHGIDNLAAISRVVGREEVDTELAELRKMRISTDVGDDGIVRTFITNQSGEVSEIDPEESRRRAAERQAQRLLGKPGTNSNRPKRNSAVEKLGLARQHRRGAIKFSRGGIDYTKLDLKKKAHVGTQPQFSGIAPPTEAVNSKGELEQTNFPDRVHVFRNLVFRSAREKDYLVQPKSLPGAQSTRNSALEQVYRYEWEELANDPKMIAQRNIVEKTRDAVQRREIHEHSPADVVDEDQLSLENTVRTHMLKYYERFPTNLQIHEPFAKISAITQPDGDVINTMASSAEMPIHEARELARAHGLDLVKRSSYRTSDGQQCAVCSIEDSEARMQSVVEFEIKARGLAPKVRPCVEVAYRGVTDDFMVEVKSKFVAEFLLRKYPVRIALTEYGTPREGFPVLENILFTVKTACTKLKAYHTASRVRSSTNEISLYLHPDTAIRTPSRVGSLPPGQIHHPAPNELQQAMETQLLEDQQDIQINNWALQDQVSTGKYARMVSDGTAWTLNGGGMKPGQLRKMKIRQGWLPKSNRKLHRLRHDNDLDKESVGKGEAEDYMNPRESNIDQNIRASQLLLLRKDLPVDVMHDSGHTADETGVVESDHYSLQGGDSLELGALKRALGLGRNRKKAPKIARGFASQNVEEPDGVSRPEQ